MKSFFLFLALVLILPINAATMLEPIKSRVEYDLNTSDSIIQIDDFPSDKNSFPITRLNKPLWITFINIGNGVSQTQLEHGDNNYFLYPFPNKSKVKNGSSAHKVLVSSLRGKETLSTLFLQLLNENGDIIDATKLVRFNFTYHSPSRVVCASVISCAAFNYPDENTTIYQSFNTPCSIGGGTSVDESLCGDLE